MRKVLILTSLIGFMLLTPVAAQLEAVKRTQLHTLDFPERYTTLSGITEIAPYGSTGRHTHPGVDTGYILEGEVVLIVDGKPPQRLKAGDAYQNAPGVPHDARNESDRPAKLFVVLTIEKGKPPTTQVRPEDPT